MASGLLKYLLLLLLNEVSKMICPNNAESYKNSQLLKSISLLRYGCVNACCWYGLVVCIIVLFCVGDIVDPNDGYLIVGAVAAVDDEVMDSISGLYCVKFCGGGRILSLSLFSS